MGELYGNYRELRQKYERLQEDMFDMEAEKRTADAAHTDLMTSYNKLLQKYEKRGGMLRKCRKEKEEMRKKYDEIYEHGQGLEIHHI